MEDPALFRPAEVDILLGDPSKAKAVLGWEPEVQFERGMRDTIRWYAENRDWWEPLRDRSPVVENAWTK